MRKLFMILAIGCAASGAVAADWDRFLAAGFGPAAGKDGSICYARVYDAGHLAASKAQRIRDVAIKLTLRTENGERRLDQSLVTHLVGSKQKYWSGGQCAGYEGLVAHCYVEGDGGVADFTLDADGTTLTARFADFRIWRPQDAADESDMTIDKSPADKVAKLTKAPMAACKGMGD
ncbi:MAG TPA: hypothetical protein PKA55_13970 [Rhodoblastus sp.]|nr:hypothetical protein [Rhodoblastus sp.]